MLVSTVIIAWTPNQKWSELLTSLGEPDGHNTDWSIFGNAAHERSV
jgi:hypothetical protein